jgi:hypothetical protein
VYTELICRCLSNNIYTELACMRILYGEITYVYEKDSCDSFLNDL